MDTSVAASTQASIVPQSPTEPSMSFVLSDPNLNPEKTPEVMAEGNVSATATPSSSAVDFHIHEADGDTDKVTSDGGGVEVDSKVYTTANLRKIRKQATTKFNLNPKKSMQYLVEMGLISATPQDFVAFIVSTEGLSKRKIGEWLGKYDEFNQLCLHEYMKTFDFSDKGLDDALRELLCAFRLPGEAQQIDRILEAFAGRYYETNKSYFTSQDTVFILSFSLIMLNTDLHSRSIQPSQKMTLESFINTNRGIDQGQDLPRAMLEDCYYRIKNNEIRMADSDMYESEVVAFIGPKKSGWLYKRNENLISSWKKHWFVLTDSCLYYFNAPASADPRCIIPMENVRVGRGRGKRDFVIQPAQGLTVKSVKKLDDGQMEQGSHRDFLLRAETEQDREKWVMALQSELIHGPTIPKRRTTERDSMAGDATAAARAPPELHMNAVPTIVMEGWMRKRGDFNPAWRRRYCMLLEHDFNSMESGPVLYYFGSKELAQRMLDLREDTQKGFIYIGDVERVSVCQERAHLQEVAFELVTRDRTWAVMPENQEDFNAWLSVISRLVSSDGAPVRRHRGLRSPSATIPSPPSPRRVRNSGTENTMALPSPSSIVSPSPSASATSPLEMDNETARRDPGAFHGSPTGSTSSAPPALWESYSPTADDPRNSGRIEPVRRELPRTVSEL